MNQEKFIFIVIFTHLYFEGAFFLQNQCYKTESSRLDTNPFRYKSFLFKSKLIRYTCKVDLIQIHVISSRFDTEYYTVYYFDSIAINIARSLLDSCSRWKRNKLAVRGVYASGLAVEKTPEGRSRKTKPPTPGPKWDNFTCLSGLVWYFPWGSLEMQADSSFISFLFRIFFIKR